MWYKVDFKILPILLLPTMLRKYKTVIWAQSLMAPVEALHYGFMRNRERNLYKLQHNGQVCYLRKALNDSFDIDQRRIQIVDGNKFGREYIYTHAEAKPRFLGTMFLRPSTDFEDTGVDFIVLVPADLNFNEYDMTALVDFYRLASKRYKIERT